MNVLCVQRLLFGVSSRIHINMIKKIIYILLIGVVLYFVNEYMDGCQYQTDVRLDGKVAIVTGGNTGIGKETVIDFVQRGIKVYLGCRSLDRGQKAVDDIIEQTGASTKNLILLQLDLASLASVRNFVQEFKKRERQLDLLINNAGVMWVPYSKTADGFEMTFGTNHLGHFLLTNLLADTLIASAPSRVVTVSSRGHMRGTLNFDDLMATKDYNRMSAYSNSKLANVLFALELSKRLKDKGVTSYSLHPGLIITELGRHIPLVHTPVLSELLTLLLSPFAKDMWHGARTSVYCALESGLELHTGKYFSDCAVMAPLAEGENHDVARRLWEVSLDLVKLSPEETHPALRA